ncbi:hypothetical protein QRO11_22000 [Paracidovorax citrulli]|nr:hypothetical protein [Paracidovorax citrulli]PVY65000.1 hypothetical protein C8E08_2350 [Paracidovorax citrulli]QCX10899.1 hypothetical protein APS58_2061 [Paracidovorax citrulli]REG70808.1 hypothetical protein C8E07_4024 [Paracidovorax citrulli]RLJ95360.1 hypothetical protein C8E06_4019 [Paracidovorax citrulli]UEG48460.1 hypothetical protein LKW27_21175 [Paracidovorax citrulli]
MTSHPRPTVPSLLGRFLLAACTLAFGLLLAGCGGSGSDASNGFIAHCGNPDTHCAPKP